MDAPKQQCHSWYDQKGVIRNNTRRWENSNMIHPLSNATIVSKTRVGANNGWSRVSGPLAAFSHMDAEIFHHTYNGPSNVTVSTHVLLLRAASPPPQEKNKKKSPVPNPV